QSMDATPKAGAHAASRLPVVRSSAPAAKPTSSRSARSSMARAGDVLVLTKPIGMGAVATAIKKAKIDERAAQKAMQQMATLNQAACQAVLELEIHGATNLTGFGLLGHAFGMVQGAGLTLKLHSGRVPVFPGAIQLAPQSIVSGGAARTRAWLGAEMRMDPEVEDALATGLFDAETSGGLLVAVPERAAGHVAKRLAEAGVVCEGVIGTFRPRADVAIEAAG
ncbi:MAG: selenide, water dikinase SelD, partial [Phycisphaerales bacterium]|nr:selenide, water dikinase SelD [Phycisphaerales bacterium]